MPLSVGDKQNFDTLRRAMLAGDAALLECQSVATGSPVAVVCAANRLAVGVESGQAGEVILELTLQRLVQLPAGLGLLQQHVGQMGLGLTLDIGTSAQGKA